MMKKTTQQSKLQIHHLDARDTQMMNNEIISRLTWNSFIDLLVVHHIQLLWNDTEHMSNSMLISSYQRGYGWLTGDPQIEKIWIWMNSDTGQIHLCCAQHHVTNRYHQLKNEWWVLSNRQSNGECRDRWECNQHALRWILWPCWKMRRSWSMLEYPMIGTSYCRSNNLWFHVHPTSENKRE